MNFKAYKLRKKLKYFKSTIVIYTTYNSKVILNILSKRHLSR